MTQVPDDIADVYRTTYRALVRFLYRKVWDVDRAEDLAQEAFARALVHQPENVRAWVFVVGANMVRDEARREARERRHLTLLSNTAPRTASAPDEELERAARLRRVRGALDRLTPRDREALLLWEAGLSYDEIAAHTGLARGAIGTTLARARRRLLDAYGPVTEEEHVARG